MAAPATNPSVASLSSIQTPTQPSSSSFIANNPVTRPLANLYNRLDKWRTQLDLPNPGAPDALGREVKMTHLTNFTFDGFKGTAVKTISLGAPYFQVSHEFNMGSQVSGMGGAPAGVHPGSYNFSATYASQRALLTGMLEGSGQLNGRFNWAWSNDNVTKFQASLSALAPNQSVFTVDHDLSGRDYTLSARAFNPSPADLTGTYQLSYLQSLTKSLALGAELTLNRPHPDLSEAGISYLAKLTGPLVEPPPPSPYSPAPPGPSTPSPAWIATGSLLSNGMVQTTYWQKLSDKVDAAAELVIRPDPRPSQRVANATVGVKYEMRMSSFRAQVDSGGKVSALLEQKFAPTIGFLLSADLDHWKNTSKFGLGVSFESPLDEAQIAAAEKAAAAGQTPPM